MTKDELSLLLYLETRAVDHGGLIDNRNINPDDIEIIKRWHDEIFIVFGRVCMHSIKALSKRVGHGSALTMWVVLSRDAWVKAAEERKARAQRLWEKRDWMTTAEFTSPIPREPVVVIEAGATRNPPAPEEEDEQTDHSG